MKCSLFSKLFLTQYYFTIALRKRKANNIIEDLNFEAEYVLPANKDIWAADPIIVEDGNEAYLFYEKVENNKGHIEVAEIKEDCTISEPQIILQDECHYSYPFVFRYKGEWYMIPESSAAEEVRLYHATKFPTAWEKKAVLLKERNVDTTVFEIDEQLYLLTYTIDGKSEKVIPHAYAMQLSNYEINLKEILWKDYDSLKVRGAGPVLYEGENLYRPAQVSQEQRYGDAVAFYKIVVTENYTEKLIAELKSSDLKVTKQFVDGLHTYCLSEKYEAIDIRCREFELFKIIKRVIRVLFRHK